MLKIYFVLWPSWRFFFSVCFLSFYISGIWALTACRAEVLHHFLQSQWKQGKHEWLYTQLVSKASRILDKHGFCMPQQGSGDQDKSHHTIASKLQESRLKIDLIISHCLRLFFLDRDNRVEISDLARLAHQGFTTVFFLFFLKKFPFILSIIYLVNNHIPVYFVLQITI